MNVRILCAAAAALACCPMTGAQAQDLTGSTVNLAAYCCTAPIESNRVTALLSATVGPAVEFPEGVLTSLDPNLEPVPVTIDVGASTIDIDYGAGGTTAPGGFNGFVFSFTGAPAILSVSVDPSSTYTPVVTFEGNSIFVNEAGLTLTADSRALINVTPVPEPEIYAMMLGGLGLVSALASRRRRK
ncbi:PEP-CTERM sorting domain-containing protein [Massilia suwonensis]|uniref:PEP-CTERM sorting domain-containing protein n=1 Tax=Massilia suwonensis TaxID=648895 RepID=A0ABW0MNI3_9BURK